MPNPVVKKGKKKGNGVVRQEITVAAGMIQLAHPKPIPPERRRKQEGDDQSSLLPVVMRNDELTDEDMGVLRQKAIEMQSSHKSSEAPCKVPHMKHRRV